jgi:hypothetical protein
LTRPKSPQKPRKPTLKQTGFVAGLAAGKSARQAARDAGYSEHTAAHADRDIMPAAERNFRDIVRRHIPAELVAQRIAEGLSAVETKFATFEGKITDSMEVIAYGERRMYAELAARLRGDYLPGQRIELEGESHREAEGVRQKLLARLSGRRRRSDSSDT